MDDNGIWQGWKTYLAGISLILAGAFMFWWSMRPGVSPEVAAFLQAQAMIAIPAGLGFVGIRSKQSRMSADLKETLAQPLATPPAGKTPDQVIPQGGD